MKNVLKISPSLRQTQKWKEITFDAVSYLYVLLFVYTASSKIITYGAFYEVMGQLPVIGKYHYFFAPLIPASEILISILLIVPASRKAGLLASVFLMIGFTMYLGLMIASDVSLPCSCGGVIAGMTWQVHLLFNSSFILLGIVALLLTTDFKKLKISTRGNR
jgi:hypothetical protein